MKKLFLMAVMALATVSSFAQHAVGTFTIQPKVGLNLANVTKGDGDIRVGAVAGAEFEYQVSDIFSLSAGALYSMQGCKGEVNVEGFDVDATVKLDYINIPILANVYVIKGLKYYSFLNSFHFEYIVYKFALIIKHAIKN